MEAPAPIHRVGVVLLREDGVAPGGRHQPCCLQTAQGGRKEGRVQGVRAGGKVRRRQPQGAGKKSRRACVHVAWARGGQHSTHRACGPLRNECQSGCEVPAAAVPSQPGWCAWPCAVCSAWVKPAQQDGGDSSSGRGLMPRPGQAWEEEVAVAERSCCGEQHSARAAAEGAGPGSPERHFGSRAQHNANGRRRAGQQGGGARAAAHGRRRTGGGARALTA